MKILLTGDWQTDHKNLEYCARAHDDERRLIKKYGVECVIDVGDLKDAYNPVDVGVYNFQIRRWRALKKLTRIVLMGNHDRIGQYADEKNWFSLFKAIGIKAVDKPRWLRLGDLAIACLPYIHDRNELQKAARALWKDRPEAQRRILIFHFDVKGANYGQGRLSQDGVQRQDIDFDNYDACFGGHIHLHQILAPNAIYVGNPFCFDWGERNQQKGFILYDTDTNEWKQIPSSLPGWYDYEFVKKNGIKVLTGTRIRDEIICSEHDDYQKLLEERREKIIRRYPKASVTVKAKFAEEEEYSIAVKASVSDREKIKGYVADTLPDDLDHERKRVITYLLSKLTDTNIKHVDEVRFINVKGKNVLSFAEVEFSYENRGVCLIEGHSKDWAKHSNGAGKTNFLHLLPIALDGRSFRNQSADAWRNEYRDGPATLSLVYGAGARLHKITRGRAPTVCQLWIDGEDESRGRNRRKVGETQSLIEETMGFNYDTLKTAVYIDHKVSRSFLEGTQKDRTQLLSKFQRLDRFTAAHELVSKDTVKVLKSLRELEDQYAQTESELHDYRSEYKSAKKKELSSLDGYLLAVSRRKRIFKIADARYAKLFRETKANTDDFTRSHTEAYNKHIEYDKEIYSITDELDKQKREIEKVERLRYKNCPVCRQPVKASSRKAMYRKLSKDLEKLTRRFKDRHKHSVTYKTSAQVIMHRILKIKRDLDALKAIRDDAELQFEKAYVALRTHQKSGEHLSESISTLKTRIRNHKRLLKRNYDAQQSIRDDLRMMEYCKKCFGRDGIPLYLNGLACPVLNRAAKKYSELFTDGEIQIKFKLEDGELIPYILNSHGSKTMAGQSTGEEAWAAFIVALSLRELGPKTNLLILDEPGYGLDTEGAKTMGRRLLELEKLFETILVVTHNRDIASVLDGKNTIHIEKEGKISRILK